MVAIAEDIVLRNSERITWTTCPQKWWWAYVERLRAPGASPALRLGSLVHSALEAFYLPGIKRGPLPALTFERLYEESQRDLYTQGMRDDEGDWHELGELGLAMLTAYHAEYGADDRWHVIGTELPFRVMTEDRVTGAVFEFVGVVDGLWGDRTTANKPAKMKKYVIDHKTTKDDPTKKAEALILDEQAGSYWSYGVDGYRARGILGKNEPLTGMLFNFLRKGKPDLRPKNSDGHALNKPKKDALEEYMRIKKWKRPWPRTVDEMIEAIGSTAWLLGEVSQKQPVPLFHREWALREEFEGQRVRERTEDQVRVMRWQRQGKLPIWKTPGTLHSPHCNWCEFKDMCELHEVGADWELYRDQAYGTWDPYEQHELYDERGIN